MNKETGFWFISYDHRAYDVAEWTPRQGVIDQHPLVWLLRVQAARPDPPERDDEYQLRFWAPISEALYRRAKDELE